MESVINRYLNKYMYVLHERVGCWLSFCGNGTQKKYLWENIYALHALYEHGPTMLSNDNNNGTYTRRNNDPNVLNDVWFARNWFSFYDSIAVGG